MQARALANTLQYHDIAAIYSSPMERCIETAEPLAQEKGIDVGIEDDINEIEIGDWTLKSLDELEHDPAWIAFNESRTNNAPPGGEHAFDIQRRMLEFTKRAISKHPDSVVVAFSHADPIRAALAGFLSANINIMPHIEISACGYSAVRFYEGWIDVQYINRLPY